MLVLVGCGIPFTPMPTDVICPSEGVWDCTTNPECYPGCTEVGSICAAEIDDGFCPLGTDPVFVDGSPVWEACLFVGATVCNEQTAVFCCTPGPVYEPLSSAYYCDVGGTPDADWCPTPGPCLTPMCDALNGNPPGPAGEQFKCYYDTVPLEGQPCECDGVCAAGVCQH